MGWGEELVGEGERLIGNGDRSARRVLAVKLLVGEIYVVRAIRRAISSDCTGRGPQAIASFSIRQVGWFSWFFRWRRGRSCWCWSGGVAGGRGKGERSDGETLLVGVGGGLARAIAWDHIWDYNQKKYASNEVIDVLFFFFYEGETSNIEWPLCPPCAGTLLAV